MIFVVAILITETSCLVNSAIDLEINHLFSFGRLADILVCMDTKMCCPVTFLFIFVCG